MEWLYVTIAHRSYYEVCLLLTSIPVIVFLYMLRKRRKNVQCFYKVCVEHEGKTIRLFALYDTGNRLLDPYLKEPVHIVSKEIYENLGGKEVFPIRLIPFASVGCQNGMLEAFNVEKIQVAGEEETWEIAPAVLAAAEESLFQNRAYQMILNSSSGKV